jgi:hypothetical protein
MILWVKALKETDGSYYQKINKAKCYFPTETMTKPDGHRHGIWACLAKDCFWLPYKIILHQLLFLSARRPLRKLLQQEDFFCSLTDASPWNPSTLLHRAKGYMLRLNLQRCLCQFAHRHLQSDLLPPTLVRWAQWCWSLVLILSIITGTLSIYLISYPILEFNLRVFYINIA